MNDSQFPNGFLWGAATSAYQVEGSPLADGAGPSIWHRFTHTPGNTALDETGDVACDHYHRFRDDVAIMAQLGLTTYRFSTSWSRVLPEGRGAVNVKGVDFYSRLVDALLEHRIRPNVTLYHWDLPAALDDRGGWVNPDVAGWFADYADLMFRKLGDRVDMWATLNEPWVVVDAGYLRGLQAPGHRSTWEAVRAAHNLLRAHGTAVQAYRAAASGGSIGIVVNLEPKVPASDSEADLAAVQRADAYMNRYYLDAVLRGSYPDELPEIFGDAWPGFTDTDMALISEPIDFLGINFYKRGVTRHDSAAWPVQASLVRQPQSIVTDVGWEWEVHAPALTDVLLWVRDRYGELPLFITENGAAFYDPPQPIDGAIDDPLRVHYLREHVRAAHAAIRQGVNLRGYYAWSLLDNFEWTSGYARRFGIVHVNFASLERTPKRSAHVYSDIIRSNGAIVLEQEPDQRGT
jgi:beta-glucosidase